MGGGGEEVSFPLKEREDDKQPVQHSVIMHTCTGNPPLQSPPPWGETVTRPKKHRKYRRRRRQRKTFFRLHWNWGWGDRHLVPRTSQDGAAHLHGNGSV